MRTILVLSALWTVAILVACLIPSEDLPVVSFSLTDKIIHMVMFAGFGLLWLRATPARRLAVFGWGLGLAVLIEVLQNGIPILHRSGDPLDVVADVAGLGLAFVIDAAMGRRATKRLSAATGPRHLS